MRDQLWLERRLGDDLLSRLKRQRGTREKAPCRLADADPARTPAPGDLGQTIGEKSGDGLGCRAARGAQLPRAGGVGHAEPVLAGTVV